MELDGKGSIQENNRTMRKDGLTYAGRWLGVKIGRENPDKCGLGGNLDRGGRSHVGRKVFIFLNRPERDVMRGGHIEAGAAMLLPGGTAGIFFLTPFARPQLRATGVAGGILQAGMSILAQAQDVTLHSCLPGQKKNQQTDERYKKSG